MLKLVDNGTAGLGIVQDNSAWYPVRWLLTCGHMISDWHKECKCQLKSS